MSFFYRSNKIFAKTAHVEKIAEVAETDDAENLPIFSIGDTFLLLNNITGREKIAPENFDAKTKGNQIKGANDNFNLKTSLVLISSRRYFYCAAAFLLLFLFTMVYFWSVLFLFLLFPKNFYYCNQSPDLKGNLIKVDCHPDFMASAEKCAARGCIWTASAIPNEPWCYFETKSPSPNFVGYRLTQVLHNSTDFYEAQLSRYNTTSLFGGDDDEIVLRIHMLSDKELEILFKPLQGSQGRNAHLSLIKHRVRDKKAKNSVKSAEKLYEIEIQNEPFAIRVVRKKTGQAVFDTFGIPGFIHSDQFLSLTTKSASFNVYGFGEQVHPTLKHDMNWRKWGMFAKDQAPSLSVDNLYGVHPFHLCVENDGNTHGIFLINSNAQHVELSPYPAITYRTIGGLLNFLVFLGPSPDEVVQQLNSIIGMPHFPPYWALGFHICRFGYRNTSNVEKIWRRNQKAGIPQDSQWIDIDYMDKRKDFTYDRSNFTDLPLLGKKLKENDTKLVLIWDPAIASNISENYGPLVDGLRQNVFIIDPRNKQPIQGEVWPGRTYFPDWTNPNTSEWWKVQAKNFYNDVNYDGVWLDMNEPANFVHGSVTECASNKWNNPPFVPLKYRNINANTVCMDAIHYSGLHYDLHNLYGFQESIATSKAMRDILPNQRPFILSRSTFIGSGAYAAHWTGDNLSQWPHMKLSIITSIEFNFFGIPFVGADICGFGDDSSEELCTRWMQLGAFYPFSRNHNSDDQIDQDPAAWSPKSINSSKNALTIRYKFLPYLYTLMWRARKNGTAVMRPLFFEFPKDAATYNIDDQFLWGSGLMIAPILTQNTTSRSVYFPEGRWFALLSGDEVDNATINRTVSVNIGPYDIGLFVQGGNILPWQIPAQTTAKSRKNPMGLLVALDVNELSDGHLYWDDGISLNNEAEGKYSIFSLNVSKSSNLGGLLTITRVKNGYNDTIKLDTIQIYGIRKQPTTVNVNGISIASTQIAYDAGNKTVALTRLGLDIFSSKLQQNVIQWIFDTTRSFAM